MNKEARLAELEAEIFEFEIFGITRAQEQQVIDNIKAEHLRILKEIEEDKDE